MLEPEWLNVCFTVDGLGPDEVVRRLEEQSVAVVGFATVRGTPCVRLVLSDGGREDATIDSLFDAIDAMVQ